MGWVRLGDCPPSRCQGQCCKHIGMWVEPHADADWLATRGLPVMEIHGRFLVDINQRCSHLTADNLCDLYNLPSRPQNCVDWPIDPSNTLLDDCGFRFEWQEDKELAK